MTAELWLEIETKCEGKTISTLSANDCGMIIHFTDGCILYHINGILKFDELNEDGVKKSWM